MSPSPAQWRGLFISLCVVGSVLGALPAAAQLTYCLPTGSTCGDGVAVMHAWSCPCDGGSCIKVCNEGQTAPDGGCLSGVTCTPVGTCQPVTNQYKGGTCQGDWPCTPGESCVAEGCTGKCVLDPEYSVLAGGVQVKAPQVRCDVSACNQPDCKDEKCECSSAGRPNLVVGEPVDLAAGTSVLWASDFGASQDNVSVGFARSFVSGSGVQSVPPGVVLHGGGISQTPVAYTLAPKPFGSAPANPRVALWSHGLWSYVKQESGLYAVKRGNGAELRFTPCATAPCWAGKAVGDSAPDKLQRTSSGFVLVTPTGERHLYTSPWNESGATVVPSHYFLTQIESNRGKVLAALSYSLPQGLTCVAGTVAGSEGVPYLSQVTLPNGESLRFEYVQLGPTGGTQCVVRRLYRRVTLASSQTDERLHATYSYVQQAGVEQPGLLSRVDYATGEMETYDYPVGSLVMSRSDVLVARHTYSAAGQVTVDEDVNANLQVGKPFTGYCASGQNCCGPTYTIRQVTDQAALTGKMSAAQAYLIRAYDSVTSVGAGGAPTLLHVTDSCSGGGCSPGTTRYDWTCGTTSEPPVLKGVQDKRGNWTVYDHAFVTDSSGTVQPEKRKELKGALYQDGGVALEETRFTYAYDNGNQQLPTVTERDSVLMPAGGKARKVSRYAPGTSRVVATLESGWTRSFTATTGAWSDESRVRGTFYFTARTAGDTTPDPEGRTLEEHGPCWVASEAATDCPSGTSYRVVRYHYWPDSAGWPRAGKLSERSEEGTGVTALVTTFDYAFDTATGEEVATQTDANGVLTESRTANGRVVSSRVLPPGGAPAVPTSYGYDSAGHVTWTRLPEGNYEVSCYRTGTPTAACAGGTMTSKLQWRARSAVTDGATWSEKVTYSYWVDGTVQNERYLDAAGNVRRVRGFSVDAHRRLKTEVWGDNSGLYRLARGYDGSNNLSGIGLPYPQNSPDCDYGTPTCTSMLYDRADRLSLVDEFPANNTATRYRTCFKHDTHGNVTSVETGLTASTDCDTYSPGAGATLYTYDDFGQLVQVDSPAMGTGSSRGATRYAYDVNGQQTVKQTPSQAALSAQDYVESTHDVLGRLTRVAHLSPTAGTEVLYAQGYDTSQTAPASCGALDFTVGRMRWRDDSFGRTWYGYDWAGRVVREVRIRNGSTGCSASTPNANPHTAYTYSPNGNLTSITYPYGRTVQYVHGTGAWADRVQEVHATVFGAGGISSEVTLLSQVAWEPYAGLRGYRQHLQGSASTVSVEYRLGKASQAVDRCSSEANGDVGANDKTGRTRALWVSTLASGASWVPGAGNGAVLRQTYVWAADQLNYSLSCLLGGEIFTSPSHQYTYDMMQRLTSAAAMYQSPGVPFSSRSFGYDGRGNRTSEAGEANAWTLTYGAAPAHPDWLTQRTSQQTGSWLSYAYTYDADGRVTQKRWPNAVSGTPVHTLEFTPGAWAQGGNDTVFRTANVQGASYSYYYDTANRRRVKVYPTGAMDEYFYDMGHSLLVDVGNDSLLSPAAHPTDEYVWLDGRPVALIRGRLDVARARESDGTADCQRAGEAAACGVYPLMTDYLGKPTLLLDGQGRVAGSGEYDAFGHVNRVSVDVETPHPYSTLTGTFGPTLKQPTTVGTSTQMRLLVDALDLYAPQGADCASSPTDALQVRDATSGAALETLAADQRHKWTGWLTPGSTGVKLAITSAGDCDTASAGCACAGSAPTVGRTQMGAAASAFEYRRFQTGAQPLWTPVRFPGHYHDAETDLFENWNRYYDPSIGRYLQPEPLLQSPLRITLALKLGEVGFPSAYAYAGNNPVGNFDADGRTTRQYRRDGTGSTAAEVLHNAGRVAEAQRCAKKANEILNECLNKEECEEPPPLPENPSSKDYNQRFGFLLNQLLKRNAKCEKIARCLDLSCMAWFDDLNAVMPTEVVAFDKCMQAP
ncbi:RHS repeat-associated core domain-containing protein [Pyxidicoccus caerfyrddinensis]|uniref:RHS repeat-associated core domain-containing protein n=1 Tax=Pyxidicoccus caerfyrddinensis TaxID=2709663 RepID=UPI0013DAF881|nr:RHS repeat-associated core domain-containing protein [Pyxidicoccus caerfyrddinensis]